MRKLPQKSQASRAEPKTRKPISPNIDTSFSDQDIDDFFRFDDKLIGKRTNTVFEAKPTYDGFFDIIHDSLESSEEEISSSALALEAFGELLESSKGEGTEDNSSKIKLQKLEKLEKSPEKVQQKLEKSQIIKKSQKAEKKSEKPIEKKTTKVIEKSVLRNRKQGPIFESNENSDDDQVKPTSKKKSYIHSPSKYDEEDPDIQKLEEAKSKARSEENLTEANQKVETNNREIVRVSKRFLNKNQIQEKRREEKEKQRKKQTDESESIHIAQKEEVSKEKQDVFAIQDKDLSKGKKMTVTEKVIQASKMKQLNRIKKSEKERVSVPKKDGFEKKKTIKESKETDETIPRFEVKVDVQKPAENEEYEPFGRMGDNDRYPKRLRIPPLRFWHNERRHYDRGMLSSITLVDDKRGRKFKSLIESQI